MPYSDKMWVGEHAKDAGAVGLTWRVREAEGVGGSGSCRQTCCAVSWRLGRVGKRGRSVEAQNFNQHRTGRRGAEKY